LRVALYERVHAQIMKKASENVTHGLWSARTCLRFKSGDMPPHSIALPDPIGRIRDDLLV
jgi:hypothetical protein